MRNVPSSIHQTTKLTIPFHDVDAMEIVWHGHYVKYAEIARHDLMKIFDYDYPQMVESGYAWPIIEFKMRYIRPSYYGMELTIESSLKEYQNRLWIDYLMKNPDGQKVCKGYSVQVAVDVKSREMCLATPKVLTDLIEARLSV